MGLSFFTVSRSRKCFTALAPEACPQAYHREGVTEHQKDPGDA